MIPVDDISTEFWPSRESRGGQHVGTGPSGVKVTHIPSGIVAYVDIGRSPLINRQIAIEMIEAARSNLYPSGKTSLPTMSMPCCNVNFPPCKSISIH